MMFKTRDLMAPVFRRLSVRYRSERGYPEDAYTFQGPSLVSYESYPMTLHLTSVPGADAFYNCAVAASWILASFPEVRQLHIEK